MKGTKHKFISEYLECVHEKTWNMFKKKNLGIVNK